MYSEQKRVFYGSSLDTLYLNNNTIADSIGANSALANAVSLLNGSGWFSHQNNMYVRNANATQAILSVSGYGSGDPAQFVSTNNLYANKHVSSGIFSGTFGATVFTSSSLALWQAKGFDLTGTTSVPTFNEGSDPLRPYYMLTNASVGRNAGTITGYVYAINDLKNNPVTGTPDMGAYDYDSLILVTYRRRRLPYWFFNEK